MIWRHRSRFLFALLSLAGCLVWSGCESDEYHGAAKLVAHHFDRIANEDYSHALDEYAPEFFQKTPRKEWETKLRTMTVNLGELQSYKIGVATIRKETSGKLAGSYVSVQCRATYKKFKTEEELVYFKRLGSDEFEILKHRLTSAKPL